MEGFGPDKVSDLAATTYAGTMRRARIANGMNFFISISPLWMVLRLHTIWFDKPAIRSRDRCKRRDGE
jgi:hypothetical protein